MKNVMPSFLIPGAGKSGTTSLSFYLNQHPAIFVPPNKEPAFFSTIQNVGTYSNGLKWYKDLFTNTPDNAICGEASTIYMYDPESARLIKKHLSEVKLIFIMRDPIARSYSNYWQDIKAGRKLPDFPELIQAINWDKYNLFKPDLFDARHRGWAYLYTSDYYVHIMRFLQYFPKESMRFLLFEDLLELNSGFFSNLFSFIGVEPNFTPINLQKKNLSSIPRYRLLQCLLKNTHVRSVGKAIPFFASTLKNMAASFGKRNQISFKYPPMNKETKAILMDFFLPKIEMLEDLIDRDLSQWKIVNLKSHSDQA